MPDADDYPTDEELNRIRTWPADDPAGWLAFVRTCWNRAIGSWLSWPRPADYALVSTGGWSGNEAIIDTMKAHPLWATVWQSTRRGGHYEFLVPA